ncbi:MAG: tetratricopeptide repeat protein [Acidobacteria bacterium]|nr:tetratricopeptide repeat protein [Acidobacteriota bacterium]MDW7983903.1 tetratricopeptide repeat protein [Acidobacteriota bacterium]
MPNLEALFLENLTKGKSLLDQGQYEEAIAYLERAYRIKPDDIKVLNMLGTAYFKVERLDSAEEIYEILARKNPNVPVLYSNLGMIRLKKKDWEGAEMAFQRVIELQPDNRRAYGYLGLIYEQQGLLEQALTYYEQAGAEGPAERVRARLRTLRPVAAVVTEEPIDEADIVAAEPLAVRAPEPSPPPSPEPMPAWGGPPPAPSAPVPGETTTRPLEEVIRALQSQPMPWEPPAPSPPTAAPESPVSPPEPVPPGLEAVSVSVSPVIPEEVEVAPPMTETAPSAGRPSDWSIGMVIPIPPAEALSPTPEPPTEEVQSPSVSPVSAFPSVEAPAPPPAEAEAPLEPTQTTPRPFVPPPESLPVSIQERVQPSFMPGVEVTAQIPTGRPVNLGIYAREQLYVYPPVGSERFLLLEPHLLEVVLSDRILFREGSLVGYSGDLRFEAVEIPSGPPVVMAQGFGLMFLAYERRSIHLISLNEETIYVAMPCFLVAQATLHIQPRVIAEDDHRMFAYMEISGRGTVGFVIRSKPLILKVLRHMPAVVHSDAVVAWTGTMRVAPVEDPYSRALIRTYSETAIPLRFEGAGDLITEQSALWGERRTGPSPA